jgi:hypothetical protein
MELREVVGSLDWKARREGEALGLVKGKEVGLAEGLEKGLAEGLVKGKALLITDLLCQRFGQVSTELEQWIQQAPEGYLDACGRRIFDAKSINEVIVGY